MNYDLFRCFSDFPWATYGERFIDLPSSDGFTSLSIGVFCWLMNIWPGYLVFRQGNICSIEPYMPSRFTHQFGYDQLYVGNQNIGLHFSWNLYEGAQPWYYFVTGCTSVTFSLPQKTPNFYTTLGFYTWYAIATSVPGYNINVTCTKEIKVMYRTKKNSKKNHLRGMNEFRKTENEASQIEATDIPKPDKETIGYTLVRCQW